MDELQQILGNFIDNPEQYTVNVFGSGLIHHTFLVRKDETPVYILQEVNHHVFKSPEAIASNVSSLFLYLKEKHSNEVFPDFIKTKDGNSYHYFNENPYRLSTFIKDSHSIDFCSTPEQAFQAALQFGKFTSLFNDYKIEQLQDTIPQFHDLNFRWQQFETAFKTGNQRRIEFSKKEIETIYHYKNIPEKFSYLKEKGILIKRVTHHDTKISNVLFDENNKSICVIDLDTTMSGFFISDLGDMFRTYLSEFTEEETDFEKVVARKEYYSAIVDGYTSKMSTILSNDELKEINFSGEFMIYMQALRFLTDYLNDDIYYGAKYDLHNYNRAKNQLKLLEEFNRIKA